MEKKLEAEINEYKESLNEYRDELIKKVKESEGLIVLLKKKDEEIDVLRSNLNIQNQHVAEKTKGKQYCV